MIKNGAIKLTLTKIIDFNEAFKLELGFIYFMLFYHYLNTLYKTFTFHKSMYFTLIGSAKHVVSIKKYNFVSRIFFF